MRTQKTKRKFDLSVVMRTWGIATIVGGTVKAMLVLIIASSSTHLDGSTLALWAGSGLVDAGLCWAVLRAWRKNNGFLVNNFTLVRATLSVFSGAIYGSGAYLFLNDLSPTAQVVFCVAMLFPTYVAIPAYYDFITGFCLLWALIWVPYNLASRHDVSAVLVLTLALAALITGLFLCRVLSRILTGAFAAQQKMSSAATTLNAANSDMKLFFLAANHDLAQPLTAIEYALRTLEDAKVDDPVVQQAVKNIKTSSSTLGRLIGDIIQFEKATSTDEPVKVTPTPLFPIFDRIVNQVEGLANDKEIGVWARQTTRIAMADEFMLERVLQNLVENAIRNTIEGSVLIAARPRGKMISIEVWDTGVGILPENLGNVFELFHQTGRRDGAKLGHGIGLKIVRTLSEKMGFTIVVNSVPDHGTVFRVLVPAWIPQSDGSVLAPPPRNRTRLDMKPVEAAVSRHGPWGGVCIALLEDDETLRQQMSASFSARGATVYQGKNVDELVAAVRGSEHSLDVLVTDWNLGTETGERAKDLLTGVPGFRASWVVISGDIDPSEAERLRTTGVAVLMKPFGPDRLINIIDEVRA